MASAMLLVKAFTAGQSAFGFSGATTCSPLPPEVLTKLGMPDGGKPLPDLDRGGDDLRPAHRLAGIEIHDDHVRLVQVRQRRTPGMDLQDGRLDQADQPVEIVDGQQRFLGILGIAHLPDAAAQALPGMLLEEALARDALRAAHQRQRPADDEGRHVAPDLGVVLRQALLGDAGVGPVDPVGMGQLDRGARRRLGAAATRFADDLAGVLVLAQAAEGGMAQDSGLPVQPRNSTSATSCGLT